MIDNQVKISFPITKYVAEIRYSDTRKAVALEWAILNTVDEFSDFEYFLIDFLEQILKIKNSEFIVKDIMDNLLYLSIIDIPYNYRISDLKICDIKLTEAGKALVKEGKMPTKESISKCDIYFDILTHSIIKNRSFVNEPEGILVNDDSYVDEEFPKDILMETVVKSADSILKIATKTTKIISISECERCRLWRDKIINFIIDESGNAKLTGLTNVEKNFIDESKLINIIAGNKYSVDEGLENIPVSKEDNIVQIYDFYDLKEIIFESVKENKVSIVNCDNNIMEYLISQFDDESVNGKLIIHVNSEINSKCIEMYKKNTLIKIPSIEEMDNSICYINGSGKAYYKGKLPIKTNNQNIGINAPVIFNLKENYSEQDMTKILVNIIDELSKEKLINIAYKSYFINSRETFAEIVEKVKELDITMDDKLSILNEAKNLMISINNKVKVNWKKEITKIELQNDGEGLNEKEKIYGEYKNIYIIDTNILIDEPDILNRIHEDEFIVISKKVLDELDAQKMKKQLSLNVRKAIRSISNYTRENIMFVESDKTLLSDDYRVTGDNLILSVALMYKKHNPIILTSDLAFKLKARSEGIESLSLDEFNEKRALYNAKNHL
ncbi:MAG: PIN domain-containing protein [Clostridium beijerinckii]